MHVVAHRILKIISKLCSILHIIIINETKKIIRNIRVWNRSEKKKKKKKKIYSTVAISHDACRGIKY